MTHTGAVVPREGLIGTWRLKAWVVREDSGRETRPLGMEPDGLLTYTADGFMFAMLMAPGRQRHATDDPMGSTQAEAQASMAGFHAYSGRYRLEPNEPVVIHSVEMALLPNMIGTEQRRFYRFEGEGRMVLRTPPITRKGAHGIAELVWERVEEAKL
jgi:hypothetical protein